jgi:DNA-binding cell septation regulator SpoVG
MNSKRLTTQKIGFRKIIKAINNCDETVQEAVLEEYRKL